MSLEFLDIGAVKDGEEISAVQFECSACGRCLETIRLGKTGKIDGTMTAQICEKRCSRCGKHPSFNFSSVGEDQKPEKSGERYESQKQLWAVLAENLKQPTDEMRLMIQFLMKDRNLKLRFGVERANAKEKHK